MSRHSECLDSCEELCDADLVREVWPRYPAVKLLAALAKIPLDTAKNRLSRKWLTKLSPSYRRKVALALLAEMDKQDMRRPGIRRQLQAMADEEVGSAGRGMVNHSD